MWMVLLILHSAQGERTVMIRIPFSRESCQGDGAGLVGQLFILSFSPSGYYLLLGDARDKIVLVELQIRQCLAGVGLT